MTLIREESGGWARRLVLHVPEHEWHLEPGDMVQLDVIENTLITPDDRV